MIAKESKKSLDFLESLIGKKTTLGDYLLAIRQGEELSQVEFAKKLGYSSRNFVRICLQDLLDRDGIDLFVDVQTAA